MWRQPPSAVQRAKPAVVSALSSGEELDQFLASESRFPQ